MTKLLWLSKDSFLYYGIIVLNNLSLDAALPIMVTLFLCITTREGAEPRIVTVRSIRTNNGIACEE